MTSFLPRLFAAMVGIGISLTVVLLLASPFLVGLLIVSKRLRYRDWVAALAFLVSLAILSTLGDYFYNLAHWSHSRGSWMMAAIFCLIIVGNPFFLAGLIWTRTGHRRVAAVLMGALAVMTVLGIRRTYLGRMNRDQVELLHGLLPVNPGNSLVFARADRRYVGTEPRYWVEGHVLEGSPVVLLSDPVNSLFPAQFCTGTATRYHSSMSDPAIPGNFTELSSLSGCQESVVYPIAVLGIAVQTYQPVPIARLPLDIQAALAKALPAHVTRQTAFILNDQTYVAALVENPAPPHSEAMNDERSLWLFRVDTPKIKQIWPAS
jgi:hypothetical protein